MDMVPTEGMPTERPTGGRRADAAGPADDGPADPGWWAQTLTSTLIVGRHSLQLLESWTMVAEMPLDEVLVRLNLDLPADAQLLPDSVVYGGELSQDPWPHHPGCPEIAVRLPKLLDVLDRHDFGLRVEVPRLVTPLGHLCRPAVGCRALELRVRFLGDAVPAAVRVVGADGPADGDEPPLGDLEEQLLEQPVDRVGEVVVRFRDLPAGAVRGLRWDGVERSAAQPDRTAGRTAG